MSFQAWNGTQFYVASNSSILSPKTFIRFSILIWCSPEIQCLKVQLHIQQMKSIEIVAFSCLFLLIKFHFSIDDSSSHVHNNVRLCWKSRNLPYFQSHPQFDENGNFVPLQNLQNQARGPSRQIQYCCNPRIKIGKIVEIIKGRFLGKIGKGAKISRSKVVVRVKNMDYPTGINNIRVLEGKIRNHT